MSKDTSIFTSIMLYVLGFVLVSMTGLALWLYDSLVAPLEPQFLGQTLAETYIDIEKRMSSKLEEGKAIATAITAYHGVIDGLNNNDHDRVFDEIEAIHQHFAETSKYQNILTKVITNNHQILATSWDREQTDGIINSSLLAEMERYKKVSASYAVSEKGFGALAYSPVLLDQSLLGAVETFSGVYAIAKDLKELGIEWILVLDKTYLKQHYGQIPDSVKNNQSIDENYLVAHPKWFEQKTIDFINHHHYHYNLRDGYDMQLIDDKVLINVPVYDNDYQVIGRHIILKNANMIKKRIADAEFHILTILLVVILSLISIVAIVMLLVKQRAFLPLNQLIESIEQVVQKGQFEISFPEKKHDEVGRVYHTINKLFHTINNVIISMEDVVTKQSNGDLTAQLTGDFHGQIAQMQHTINHASEHLRHSISHAVKVSYTVGDAAKQVSKGSMNLASRVQEQANALAETSATMTQMTAAVEANTQNANHAANIAIEIQYNAKEGYEVMQQAIDAMSDIQDSSRKIQEFVGLINDISMKTNMLALNASVEAARAGEHGHGFAVVANEVKTLAIKSADAAKDIKLLMNSSAQRIEYGTGYVEQSGSMFNQIKSSLDDITTMIKEIALASNEQNDSISHIHNAINDIDRITQENAALVEQTSASASALNEEAQQLRDNMSFFKTQ